MKLKDGTPMLKKEFDNISFDPSTNTFKGTLNFGRNPWLDYFSMDFTLKFSEDYDSITEGKREGRNEAGQITYVGKYGPLTFNKYVLFKQLSPKTFEPVSDSKQ